MRLFNSLKFYIIIFITCEMLIECLCQLPGMCWEEYRSEIVTNNHQDNVLYVCTNSQLSNATDTVYMDLEKVPRFENSMCYCTVTFTNKKKGYLNSVRLDYTIESSADALTVNGYGYDRFSIAHATHIIDTTLKVNNITFKLTSPKTDFKSCLRITSEKASSLFRVECYFNHKTPEADRSSSTKISTTQTSTQSTKSQIENEIRTTLSQITDTSTGSENNGPLGTTLSQITDTSTGSENNGPLGTTLSQITDTSTGSENNGPLGAVIGGAVGGGVFLVIVTVIAVLVLKRRETKTDQRKNEDHYINEIGLNNVGDVTTDSANDGTYETPVANSVDENKYETLTINTVDGSNYETLTTSSADGTNYETLLANSVDENKYEPLTAPVAESADEYKYENIAAQSTDESKYENVTENDNFSAKSTNIKAYVNEDVIQSIKK